MSVGFYMDENADGRVARALRTHGFDVLTVQEDGRDGDPDESVLARAAELGRLVFTSDADFLAITTDLLRRGEPFLGVVYAHKMRLTVGDCVRELEVIAYCSEPGEWRSRIEHLPL